jgi:hypothetical protein
VPPPIAVRRSLDHRSRKVNIIFDNIDNRDSQGYGDAEVEAAVTAAAGGRDERFFVSTRGQVAALLRHGDRTVEALAQALGLTENAVRARLTTLDEMAEEPKWGIRHDALGIHSLSRIGDGGPVRHCGIL